MEGWRENVQLQARFVEDVTIPDGCVVSPTASLRKSWKLENSGDNAWPEGCYMMIQAGNPSFGIQADETKITLPALQPGEQCVAEVDVRAPVVPSRYTTYWRVCDPSGTQFGHRFWIDIIVAADDDDLISLTTTTDVEVDNVEIAPEVARCDEEETVTVSVDADSDSSSDSGSDSSSDSASDIASDSGSDDSSDAGDDNDEDGEGGDNDDDADSDDDDVDDVEIVGVRVAETAGDDQYADALAMLASMGFEDETKNRRHLDSAEGNITNAVISLLAE
jgi:hypothetical protein